MKSPYEMQTLSDIMGVPIKAAATQQAGALGAAMCAGVASGLFPTIEKAQEAFAQGYKTVYIPRGENRKTYNVLYGKYCHLGGKIS